MQPNPTRTSTNADAPNWAARAHRSIPTAVWVLVGIGLALRLGQYAAGTSLWHDESFVALIVLQTPFDGLLGSLDWNEASPPGFLLAEKLIVSWLGSSEYALRLLPFTASLLALPAFAAMAAAFVRSGPVWLLAVALAVTSDVLIEQANLVKHFSLDLLLAIGLLWLAHLACRRSRPGAVLVAWSLLGAIGIWFSYASLFVFAGTSLVLAARMPRPGRAAGSIYLAGNLAVFASFVLLLGPIGAQRTETLVRFWQSHFPDLTLPGLALWTGRAYLGLFHHLTEPARVLAAPLALAGTAWFHRERRHELFLLGAPLVVGLVASALGYWPFGGNQHMSFAAPAVLLIVAAGFAWAGRKLSAWRPAVAVACTTLIVAPMFAIGGYHLLVPRRRHEIRPAIEFMQSHWLAGDRVLALDPATFLFYTGLDVRSTPPPVSTARLWVITPWSDRGGSAPHRIVAQLESRRSRLDAFESHGAAAFLFGPERNGSLEGGGR